MAFSNSGQGRGQSQDREACFRSGCFVVVILQTWTWEERKIARNKKSLFVKLDWGRGPRGSACCKDRMSEEPAIHRAHPRARLQVFCQLFSPVIAVDRHKSWDPRLPMLGARGHLSGECTRTHSDRQALVPTLLIEENVIHLMFENHMGQWAETIPEQAAKQTG